MLPADLCLLEARLLPPSQAQALLQPQAPPLQGQQQQPQAQAQQQQQEGAATTEHGVPAPSGSGLPPPQQQQPQQPQQPQQLSAALDGIQPHSAEPPVPPPALSPLVAAAAAAEGAILAAFQDAGLLPGGDAPAGTGSQPAPADDGGLARQLGAGALARQVCAGALGGQGGAWERQDELGVAAIGCRQCLAWLADGGNDVYMCAAHLPLYVRRKATLDLLV